MRRLRVSEYAKEIGVSVEQIRHWIKKGVFDTGPVRIERYGPKPIVVIVLDDDSDPRDAETAGR